MAASAVLFVLSHQPSSAVTVPVSDKLAHAVAYAGFGWLALRATHGDQVAPSAAAVAGAWLVAALQGALDELHQSVVPGRTVEVGDWVADVVGAALAAVAFIVWRMRAARSERASRTV